MFIYVYQFVSMFKTQTETCLFNRKITRHYVTWLQAFPYHDPSFKCCLFVRYEPNTDQAFTLNDLHTGTYVHVDVSNFKISAVMPIYQVFKKYYFTGKIVHAGHFPAWP